MALLPLLAGPACTDQLSAREEPLTDAVDDEELTDGVGSDTASPDTSRDLDVDRETDVADSDEVDTHDVVLDVEDVDVPPDHASAIDVAAGEGHSCILTSDGAVFCWGRLDLSTLRPEFDDAIVAEPARISQLPLLVQIDGGGVPAYDDSRTCGVSRAGDVWCWGNNAFGAAVPNEEVPNYVAPVRLESLGALATAVETGAYHSCALIDDGTVSCWGGNEHGALGRGAPSSRTLSHQPPETVEGLSSIVEIAVGTIDHTVWQGPHSCARDETGAVWCWGNNAYGQVGNGARIENSDSRAGVHRPSDVALPSPAIDLATGSSHTCAALDDGSVWCWGNNDEGQLGLGDAELSVDPVRVDGLNDIVQLTAGGRFTCAVRRDDAVLCWGVGDKGQVGAGLARGSETPERVALPDGIDVVDIEAGGRHACILDGEGRSWCWGSDRGEAQLGGGVLFDQEVARPVVDLSVPPPERPDMTDTVAQVSAGPRSSCAIDASNRVWCWGDNSRGELGTGDLVPSTRPRRVTDLPPDETWVELDVGGSDDVFGPYYGTFTCLRSDSGRVWCWGAGREGQLGSGTAEGSGVPVQVMGLDDAQQIDLGKGHACAIRTGGELVCWGHGNELGRDALEDALAPVPVTGFGAEIIDVSAGVAHTCAIDVTGQVWCWGDNDAMQLGTGADEDSRTPTPVPGLDDAVAISAGREMTCALRPAAVGENVVCWGLNRFGELGLGDTEPRPRPTTIPGLTEVVALSVGEGPAGSGGGTGRLRICATIDDRTAHCWGYNENQDNPFVDPYPAVPTQLDALPPIASVSIGYRHMCALDTTGRALCWGVGKEGQRGDGHYPFAATPVLSYQSEP